METKPRFAFGSWAKLYLQGLGAPSPYGRKTECSVTLYPMSMASASVSLVVPRKL
jgi:hypothetical protein